MFTCAALVLQSNNALGRAAHVRYDEADAGIDFRDHSARLRPACRLVGEIGVIPPELVRRSSDRALEQIADPVLKDLVGGQPDRVFDPLGLQALVDPGMAKAASARK